jgi:hypothetical protein
MSVAIGIAAAAVALLGLFLAAKSVDAGMELFGLLLFVFGAGLNFWLIKRHFDDLDQQKHV